MTRIAIWISMLSLCRFNASLDLISVPLVLVRKSDDVAVGVLRILPYPLPQGKEHYYPAATLDSDVLPGTGRTEADMQEYFAAQQRVVETSPQTVLSGGKIGRVAVSKDMRCRGMDGTCCARRTGCARRATRCCALVAKRTGCCARLLRQPRLQAIRRRLSRRG